MGLLVCQVWMSFAIEIYIYIYDSGGVFLLSTVGVGEPHGTE